MIYIFIHLATSSQRRWDLYNQTLNRKADTAWGTMFVLGD